MKADHERVVLSKLDTSRPVPDVRCSIVISATFTWSAYLYGKKVSPSFCQLLSNTTTLLHSVTAVVALARCLDESHVCIGNGDKKFEELQKTRKGVFLDKESMFL